MGFQAFAESRSSSPTDADVLISGAGIAGTVLAHELAAGGLRPVVVERSARLRCGGNAVDLRGPAVGIVERVGVLDKLRGCATELAEFARIDAAGNTVVTMEPEVIGGDIEVLRTELNTVLFDAAQDGVTYRFDDSIAALTDTGNHVEVTFNSGTAADFGLVIGADGLHSHTRALVLGPETDFVHHLGCYQAHFTTDNILDLRHSGLLMNQPGRTVGCYSIRQNQQIVVGLFFDSDVTAYDRANVAAQQHWVRGVFADMGWRTKDLLAAMDCADDFYFDSIARVVTAQPYRGRVALVGDAAYSPSLFSGMGATLAIVGAAVLADEIIATPHDHQRAFRRYRARIEGMITLSHQLARVSREWFIQSCTERQHFEGLTLIDAESDVLRKQVLDAACTAFSAAAGA